MKKAIINKILYTVGNDLALFCLLVAVYYLPRIIPYNLALILLIIVFITAVFCFYLVRVFTVIGDIYDEDYNAVYVLLKFDYWDSILSTIQHVNNDQRKYEICTIEISK